MYPMAGDGLVARVPPRRRRGPVVPQFRRSIGVQGRIARDVSCTACRPRRRVAGPGAAVRRGAAVAGRAALCGRHGGRLGGARVQAAGPSVSLMWSSDEDGKRVARAPCRGRERRSRSAAAGERRSRWWSLIRNKLRRSRATPSRRDTAHHAPRGGGVRRGRAAAPVTTCGGSLARASRPAPRRQVTRFLQRDSTSAACVYLWAAVSSSTTS